MWNKLSIADRLEYMRAHKESFPKTSYKDMVNDFNSSVSKYEEGGTVQNNINLPSETTQMFNKPFVDPIQKDALVKKASVLKQTRINKEVLDQKNKLNDYYKNKYLVGRKDKPTDGEIEELSKNTVAYNNKPIDEKLYQIGFDLASFSTGPIGKLAYAASLPSTTKDTWESLKNKNYGQATIDALGFLPAFHHIGLKGDKIPKTKLNNTINTINLSNDLKDVKPSILDVKRRLYQRMKEPTKYYEKSLLNYNTPTPIISKNKYLHNTSDFGELKEGIKWRNTNK